MEHMKKIAKRSIPSPFAQADLPAKPAPEMASPLQGQAATIKAGDTWYRYEDHLVGHLNEWGEVGSTSVELTMLTLTVVRLTPKGVWLGWRGMSAHRFVKLNATKKYAFPTQLEALESFLARKARQQQILQRQVNNAKTAHAKALVEWTKLKSAASNVQHG